MRLLKVTVLVKSFAVVAPRTVRETLSTSVVIFFLHISRGKYFIPSKIIPYFSCGREKATMFSLIWLKKKIGSSGIAKANGGVFALCLRSAFTSADTFDGHTLFASVRQERFLCKVQMWLRRTLVPVQKQPSRDKMLESHYSRCQGGSSHLVIKRGRADPGTGPHLDVKTPLWRFASTCQPLSCWCSTRRQWRVFPSVSRHRVDSLAFRSQRSTAISALEPWSRELGFGLDGGSFTDAYMEGLKEM